MFRLASLLYTLIGTSLAGVGVIAVLSAGFVTVQAILIAAAAGAVIALPLSWVIARTLYGAAG